VNRRVPVPATVSGPAVVLGVVAVALYVIARTTGAGWDIVILSVLIALLLVSAVWPGIALTGISVRASAPPDGMVGRPIQVSIELRGHARSLRVRTLTGPSAWYRADAPSHGTATVVPLKRGVFPGIVVEVSSSSPLGFVSWRRRFRVPLPSTLEVAPRPLAVRYEPRQGSDQEAQTQPRSSTTGHEETRGVREYVDGDAIRLVHWPATARTGMVMVRELEGPQRPRLLVVVDLRGEVANPEADVEVAASRAAGLAIGALADGTLVDLATVEAGGTRHGPVRSPLEVGRRLARAVPGAPAPGPLPPGSEIRFVRVGSAG
jgi:uncharacterized protein (DUF58 family)